MSGAFDMGEHGGYVAAAYLISALGIGLLVALTLRRVRAARRRLAALETDKADR